jgi:hypothetical protein
MVRCCFLQFPCIPGYADLIPGYAEIIPGSAVTGIGCNSLIQNPVFVRSRLLRRPNRINSRLLSRFTGILRLVGGLAGAWSGRGRPLVLLHRDAFRQVARLVDVGAFEDGDVVSQQLDRDRVEQGGNERVAARHRDS